jgi:peptidyl-prolyl cis-trans isomerase B (cyclophilin B)
VLLVTSHGNLTFGFHPDKAPKHVRNFVKLAKEGFYHGTKFHRVIKGFMIQGGCPNTREGASGAPGTGDPGYRIDAEFNDTRHVKGILSMARSRDPNSAGSQFFVCHAEASQLDRQYTAFGVLESGMDTLDRIADVPVEFNSAGEASVPATPVILHAAIVLPSYRN